MFNSSVYFEVQTSEMNYFVNSTVLCKKMGFKTYVSLLLVLKCAKILTFSGFKKHK